MQYTQVFSVIVSHTQAVIAAGGYPFLFLAVFLEGLPLIGTLVPGHVAIIAGGFLAKVGVLNLYWVLSITIIGAILGDLMGFHLGRKYGMPLIDRLRRYFFVKDSQIEKTRSLIAKHTGKALVIGRFSPITRALMPFLVGTGHTSYKKFWLFNIIGAVSWAVSSILIGYAFGASYHAISGYVGKALVIAVILAIVIAWGYRFINMRFHIFRKYELFVLGLNILSLWVLAEMIQDTWASPPFMLTFDIWANLFSASHITTAIYSVAWWISNLTDIPSLAGIGVVLAAGLALHKRWRSASIMLLSLGSTVFFVGWMKVFFATARPENALVYLSDYSFPSGHAAISAAFFLVVGYLVSQRTKSWVKRESVIALCVITPIVVGLCRLALNVHWASDVIGGWAVGIFFSTASILFIRYIGAMVMKSESFLESDKLKVSSKIEEKH